MNNNVSQKRLGLTLDNRLKYDNLTNVFKANKESRRIVTEITEYLGQHFLQYIYVS